MKSGFLSVSYQLAVLVAVAVTLGVTAVQAGASSQDSFDQDVGHFHVKLVDGNANFAGNIATLSGTVAIWPKGVTAIKMTVRNASVTASKTGSTADMEGTGRKVGAHVGADSGAPFTITADGTGGAGRTFGGVGRTTGGVAGKTLQENWVSARGSGTLDLAVGAVALTIAGGSFESRPDGTVSLSGGDVSVRGCTHQVGQGSALRSADVQFSGTLRCGNVNLTNSTLRVSPDGISGGGSLQAVNHTFAMTYAATGQTIAATGAWNANSRGWQTIPDVETFEYQVSNPRVVATLSGATLTLTLMVDNVQARTKAKRPNGNPVAQAETGAQSIIIRNPNGDIALPLPGLPKLPSSTTVNLTDVVR